MSASVTTKTSWRFFSDYEKEEAWLNQMAAQGWDFAKSWLFRYRFEKGQPGEYAYRMQLLPNWAWSAKGKEYLAFVAESGAEVVDTAASWAYFRKKTADGPFELFSDLDSTIKHQKRILWVFAIPAATLGAYVVVSGGSAARPWLEVPLLIEAACVAVLAVCGVRSYRRVRALERQRRVTE
jgi:Protein of unknown function (DUF2812)